MFHVQVYSIHLVSSRAHVCLVNNVHCSTMTPTGPLRGRAIAAAAKQKLIVVTAIHHWACHCFKETIPWHLTIMFSALPSGVTNSLI